MPVHASFTPKLETAVLMGIVCIKHFGLRIRLALLLIALELVLCQQVASKRRADVLGFSGRDVFSHALMGCTVFHGCVISELCNTIRRGSGRSVKLGRVSIR